MSNSLDLSKRKYIRDLLLKAQMLGCKGSDVPFGAGLKLEKMAKGQLSHLLVCTKVLKYLLSHSRFWS